MSESFVVGDTVTHRKHPELGAGKVFHVFDDGRIAAEFPKIAAQAVLTGKPYVTYTGIAANALAKYQPPEPAPETTDPAKSETQS